MIRDITDTIPIETKVPLSMEEMKNLFMNRDKFRYVINYSDSSLKGSGFLFYISNLELPAELDLTDDVSTEDKFELIYEYMKMSNLIDVGTLAYTVMEILLVARNVDTSDMFDNSFLTKDEVHQFIQEHTEIVKKWISFMNSLYVYALYVAYETSPSENAGDANPIQQMVPKIDDPNYIGNNFINVMNLPGFFEIYFSKEINMDNTAFFTHQFTEYCFQGKNLYHFFAHEDNWLFLSVLVMLGADEDGTDNPAE